MSVTSVNVHGQKFNMHVENDLIVDLFLRKKEWEHATLRVWIEKVKATEGLILDIGAYTGVYGLLASSVDKTRTVQCFEPLKQVYDRLDNNILANPKFRNITAYNVGLCDVVKPSTICVNNNIPLPSSSSIVNGSNKKILREERISLVRGDEFIDGTVGLVKMDVEHFEYEVVRGLREIIKRDNPTFIIEILSQSTLSSIYSGFRNIGYTSIYRINDDTGEIVEITDDNLALNSTKYSGGMNYLFEV